MVRTNRNALQTLGVVLIILGIIMIMISLIGSTQTYYQCPASGCTPGSLLNVPLYGDSFGLGHALVIVGIILLIAARKMNPKQDTDT